MDTKKNKILLASLCIILLAGLIVEYLYFQNQINNKNSQIISLNKNYSQLAADQEKLEIMLQNQNSTFTKQIIELTNEKRLLEEQITTLPDQILNLTHQVLNLRNNNELLQSQLATSQTNITDQQNQIKNLEFQIKELKNSNLIKVNFNVWDEGQLIGTPTLLIQGYLVNVGSNVAYNCSLHVIAYQNQQVLAINSTVSLGNIDGKSSLYVDLNIGYQGGYLVSWYTIPKWS